MCGLYFTLVELFHPPASNDSVLKLMILMRYVKRKILSSTMKHGNISVVQSMSSIYYWLSWNCVTLTVVWLCLEDLVPVEQKGRSKLSNMHGRKKYPSLVRLNVDRCLICCHGVLQWCWLKNFFTWINDVDNLYPRTEQAYFLCILLFVFC